MADELDELRARVAALEDQLHGRAMPLAHRIDGNVASLQDLVDTFFMPLLLRLGENGYRDRMLGWLASLEESAKAALDDIGPDARDLHRLQYWADILRKREPFPDFPPDGWMSPRES